MLNRPHSITADVEIPNGRATGDPSENGWNRSTNNARFGHDYFNRTRTAQSNMFDNKPTETQYFLHRR